MNPTEYLEVKSHLLTAINLMAPNQQVQRKFISVVHEMEHDGESEQSIIKTLVGMFYDGLAYGNW